MGLFKKTRPASVSYDPETQEPVIRKSICTGEMTAGFLDRNTGAFQDLMRLDGEAAVREFCKNVGIDHARVIYVTVHTLTEVNNHGRS